MPDTQTLTLAEFLLARIAEDERHARAFAPDVVRWPWANGRWLAAQEKSGWQVRSEGNEPICRGGSAAVRFVAANDPARVLAECEAKRRIVERAAYVSEFWDYGRGNMGAIIGEYQDYVLRILAQPYADHPDFREEWGA